MLNRRANGLRNKILIKIMKLNKIQLDFNVKDKPKTFYPTLK